MRLKTITSDNKMLAKLTYDPTFETCPPTLKKFEVLTIFFHIAMLKNARPVRAFLKGKILVMVLLKNIAYRQNFKLYRSEN